MSDAKIFAGMGQSFKALRITISQVSSLGCIVGECFGVLTFIVRKDDGDHWYSGMVFG